MTVRALSTHYHPLPNMAFEGQHENAQLTEKESDREATTIEVESTEALTPYERIQQQQKMPTEKAPKEKTLGDKTLRGKVKANRELGDLEQNHILNSRLRSSSGKVYSASLTVDASNTAAGNSQSTRLESVAEGETLDANMCLKDDCCKNTTTLIGMINKLQDSVDGVMNKLSDQESAATTVKQSIAEVREDCSKNSSDIKSLEQELQETKGQLKLVQSIVIRQDEQIGFLRSRIVEMQQREMGGNIVISGIPETKNEKSLQSFNTFIQEELELQELIPANRAFRVGAGSSRPLIVELRHPESKRKIFGNASRLKGKVNSKGKPYFIADHLPEELNENRRHVNELFAENKKKPEDKKQDMSLKRGRLMIGDQVYEKMVRAPSASEILSPSAPLIETIDQLDIIKGDDGIRGKSRFISYAVAIQDVADVNAAYLKLKMEFTQATHITCAFRLPGVKTHENQDYCDDGEWGCGRTLLKVLKKEQILNIAVFLIRFYGGSHIGPARFDIFREFAREAIKQLMDARGKDDRNSLSLDPKENEYQEDSNWADQANWEEERPKTD